MRTTVNQQFTISRPRPENPLVADLQQRIKALCPDRPGLYRSIEATTDVQELEGMLKNVIALRKLEEQS